MWRPEDPQGDEAGKVKYEIVRYTRGAVLDLGCGPKKAFPHFVGVDSKKDTELFGIEMAPDVTCDVGDPVAFEATFNADSVDAIFSSHLLEHVEDHVAALKAWWSAIKIGGHLVLYLPHADLYPNIGTAGANPDHKHDFRNEDIVEAMKEVGDWDLLVDEVREEGYEYSLLQVYRKRESGHGHLYVCDIPKPAKTACVVRYGAIGDMLQAAAIWADLKREGYHVTVMCETKNAELVAYDPNIDDLYIQDKDQVPNHELHAFWEVQRKHFDRWVNLCESVEGTLLALPGRMSHTWPASVRRKHLNVNYLEFMAELAELANPVPQGFFYESPEESEWAKAFIANIEDQLNPDGLIGLATVRPFLVMYCLSGSSVHKFWPHQDVLIQRIVGMWPNAHVVLVGDYASKLLESGWENHPRVHCMAGEIEVRNTLALAKRCHVVIGPETGILNGVAFEGNAKIVLLSHSSAENLTKHWANAVAIAPRETPCHPCHQLHFDHTFCPQHDESGAAMCQWELNPDWVTDAVKCARSDWESMRGLFEIAP